MTRQECLRQLYNLVEDHFTDKQLDKWCWYCQYVQRELACTMQAHPVVRNGALYFTESDMKALQTFSAMVQVAHHASTIWKIHRVWQTVPQKNSMRPYPNLLQDFQ
jgi:hypothetical protein